jgi:hypothetical protein
MKAVQNFILVTNRFTHTKNESRIVGAGVKAEIRARF